MARTLDDTADYFEAQPLEDQVQRLLYSLSGPAGWGTEREWNPGEDAGRLRANLGYASRPTPAEAVAELAAVCVDDFVREMNAALASERTDNDALRHELGLLQGAAKTAETGTEVELLIQDVEMTGDPRVDEAYERVTGRKLNGQVDEATGVEVMAEIWKDAQDPATPERGTEPEDFVAAEAEIFGEGPQTEESETTDA